MAQSKKIEIKNNIHRERLSSKEVRWLLEKKHGILDTSFTKEYLNKTYILDNSNVIVSFDTHGYLYDSLAVLRDWIINLNKSGNSIGPSHILKDNLLYGNEFTHHIHELVDTIVQIFKLKEKEPSLGQLRIIDIEIKKRYSEIILNKYLFSGMIAYVGEVLIKELGSGKWDLINEKTADSIWEPYIVSGGKRYNPFFLVYRELYEELPETNKIEIFTRVEMELNK